MMKITTSSCGYSSQTGRFQPFAWLDKAVLTLISVLMLSGCGQPEFYIDMNSVPQLSDDVVVQKAYERCVLDTHQQMVRDNSDMSTSIRAIMYSGALQTCESAVVTACDGALRADSCEIILDIFKS